MRANWVYGHISGPAHRLDVSLRARGGVAARHLPHGLVGQSFASAAPRFGRVDELVRLPANADVERATRACRGRDMVVSVPRRAPPRRRVRRAVDPYYGRALFREPGYPPIYSY